MLSLSAPDDRRQKLQPGPVRKFHQAVHDLVHRLPLDYTAAGTNWSAADADGWMTYSQAVEPGASTESLDIKITFPDAKQGDNYNVVVVYQSTPAQYDSQGNPTPDWSQVLDEATEKEGMSPPFLSFISYAILNSYHDYSSTVHTLWQNF